MSSVLTNHPVLNTSTIQTNATKANEPNIATKMLNGFVNGVSGGFSGKTEGLEGTAGNMAGNMAVGTAIGMVAKTALKFIPGVNVLVNGAMGIYSGMQKYNSLKEELSVDGDFSEEDQKKALMGAVADGVITTAVNSVVPIGGSAVSNLVKRTVLDGASAGATQVVTNKVTGKDLSEGVAQSVLSSVALSGGVGAVTHKLQSKKGKTRPTSSNASPGSENSAKTQEIQSGSATPKPVTELDHAQKAYLEGEQWRKEQFGDHREIEVPQEYKDKAQKILNQRSDHGVVANLEGSFSK